MTDPTTTGGPAGLAARVNQIHVPEPNADRERWLLFAGFAVVVTGALLILVAYVGASGSGKVYEQVPYAISGGLLGMGLIVLGSALIIRFSLARLFRFWLARIIAEHQVQTDRTVDALARIETLLAGGTPSPGQAGQDGTEGNAAPRVRKEPLRAQPLDT